jgi:hypothetical protein
MEQTRVRTQRPLPVQRVCERSRLEDNLVAAAYELAAPVLRRSRSTSRRRSTNSSPHSQPASSAGGFSA